MNVRILYFEGCPNHEPTVDLVRDVLAGAGADADVEIVEVKDAEDAKRLHFFGSPTVQVDGVDIDPGVRESTDYAFGCRMYGTSSVPPRRLLEEAISGGTKA